MTEKNFLLPKTVLIFHPTIAPYRIDFFNDLYKLSVGDTAKVIYNNKTYTYKFVNIYCYSYLTLIYIYPFFTSISVYLF